MLVFPNFMIKPTTWWWAVSGCCSSVTTRSVVPTDTVFALHRRRCCLACLCLLRGTHCMRSRAAEQGEVGFDATRCRRGEERTPIVDTLA